MVSFLYPLFLFAGLLLAIPVLIHLFNLRRYKTVYFPHVRFLKNIQLNSRRQSQVRYKWLLAARMLFLAFMVFAFAQPFFKDKNKAGGSNAIQVIYIDNSYSMTAAKGSRNLLDIAKDAALKQLMAAPSGSKFVLLTNDRQGGFQPAPADKVITDIRAIDFSPAGKNIAQVLSATQNRLQNETAQDADLFYYSDFQRSVFDARPDAELLKRIRFFGVPVRADKTKHIYIDTAFLASPVLQAGANNRLVVKSRAIGDLPKDMPVLQLTVNGQVKSAATLSFANNREVYDTLGFQVNDAGWQQIVLTINAAGSHYDDTFRIAARSTPGLTVLALNEGQANPYIQAAFRAYTGFRISQEDINTTANWKDYNLVILNGITRIGDVLGKTINNALQQGQSICIFPGRTADVRNLNEGLGNVGDIRFAGIDTASQTVSSLQQGSPLVRDLFERIPDNIQLPQANWHYIITAGLAANQQPVMSFRNGDPFLARYTPSRGQLYICATAADLQSGNFPGSYFFVPFLYQMAVQSASNDIYAATSGSPLPVYLSLQHADERNMVHVYGKGTDMIPPQRPNGAGLDVYLSQVADRPAFCTLAAAGSDTTVVGLNADRAESAPELWDINALKKEWAPANAKWVDIAQTANIKQAAAYNAFPLWKVCVILALIMLAVETYFLAGFRKQTVAAQ